MKKTADTILTMFNYVFQFACYIFMGIKMGQLMRLYDGEKDKFLIIAVLTFATIFIWMFFHIIVHEAGHMFAGLATGYAFVSFRVGKITLVKTTYGMRLRKMMILGTAGQCLMCPPDVEPENCPYKFYHLGGSLANIIVATVFMGIFSTQEFNMTSYFWFFMPAIMGYALGISNLFPAKIQGTQNDGYNLFVDLRRNLLVRKCMNIVLTMNAVLTVVDDYSRLNGELRDELMKMDFENLDITNATIANAYLYQASLYFADRKFDDAYRIYKRLLDTEGVIKVFKNEAKCECLFYNVIKNAPAEVIDGLYDKDLQTYIKATSLYPSRHRLMYAYNLLYKKDSDKAMDELAEIMKLLDVYAIKADVKLEFDIINEIRIANSKNL